MKALAAGALLLAVLPAGSAAPARLAPDACELEHPLRLSVLPAECGTLTVPENPQQPRGRQIELHVARVPAISRRKLPDPLFVLAGGPGAAATPSTPRWRRFCAHPPRSRHRAGRPARHRRIQCAQLRRDRERPVSRTRAGRDRRRHARAASPRCRRAPTSPYYTTSLAVQDLERVRAALGYQRINLYGASYGTRVAQHYLRRFPGTRAQRDPRRRRAAPQSASAPAAPLDAEAALTRILRALRARCPLPRPLRRSRSDLPRRARRARGRARCRSASPTRPRGEPVAFDFGADHLASVLRLLSYTPRVRRAPAAAAARRGGARRTSRRSRRSSCWSSAPMREALADRHAQQRGVRRGRAVLRPGSPSTARASPATYPRHPPARWPACSVCRVWPRGPVDADLHAPLHSDVPALLLSGSDDPVTPPDYAHEARGPVHAPSRGGAARVSATASSPRPAWTGSWRASSSARVRAALDVTCLRERAAAARSSPRSTVRRRDRGAAAAQALRRGDARCAR